MKSIFLLFSFVIVVSSCNKKNAEMVADAPVSEIKSVINENPVKSMVTETTLPDCLEQYNDIKMMSEVKGTLVMITRVLMISFGESGRLNPCNLPEGFAEGDAVTFSGVVKESPKGVRLAGTPFKLTHISK